MTSLIVFANGTAGFNGEHAAADAPIPARLLAIMEAVTARLEAEKAAAEAKAASSAGHDAPRTAPGTAAAAAAAALAALPGATASSSVPGTLPAPRKLYWDLPPSAAKAVQAALAKARERIPMEELGVVGAFARPRLCRAGARCPPSRGCCSQTLMTLARST